MSKLAAAIGLSPIISKSPADKAAAKIKAYILDHVEQVALLGESFYIGNSIAIRLFPQHLVTNIRIHETGPRGLITQ
jgi:hypothetical protein